MAEEVYVTKEHLQAILNEIAQEFDLKAKKDHKHEIKDIKKLEQMLDNIMSFDVEIHDELPSQERLFDDVIYLVKSPKGDYYDEYILINGFPERIGDTNIDISDYITLNDVEDLLNSKADTLHRHTFEDIEDIQSELNKKTNVGHTHVIGDVLELQKELENRAKVGHKHLIIEVDGLKESLDAKASIDHEHDAENIHGLTDKINEFSTSIADIESRLDEKLGEIEGSIGSIDNHSHANKDVLDGITAEQITKWDNSSESGHGHEISDINNLQTTLDTKADKEFVENAIESMDLSPYAKTEDVNKALEEKADKDHNHDEVYSKIVHNHTIDEITDLQTSLDTKADKTYVDDSIASAVTSGTIDLTSYAKTEDVNKALEEKADITYVDKAVRQPHYHDIGFIHHLQDRLDEKALKTDLETKADASHTHSVSDITDLQATLDSLHSHENKDVLDGITSEMVTKWNNGSASGHTHEITSIDGLQTALDGKSNTDHNHDTIYSKLGHTHDEYATKTSLDGKADISHTHENLVTKEYVDAEISKVANGGLELMTEEEMQTDWSTIWDTV